MWKQKPADVTPEEYDALNQGLVDGSFLLEIAITLSQDASSNKVHGIGSTKRGEPLYYDTYLSK